MPERPTFPGPPQLCPQLGVGGHLPVGQNPPSTSHGQAMGDPGAKDLPSQCLAQPRVGPSRGQAPTVSTR